MSMVRPQPHAIVPATHGIAAPIRSNRGAPYSPATDFGFTVVQVKILQIAPALHGAKMQTTEGTYPVVVWALIEDDDGNRHVVGLSVGGKGDKALVPPDQGTFESYNQTG
jgi:hypothetical protein